MNQSTLLLAAGGLATLAATGAGSLVVLRLQARREKARARIARVVAPFQRRSTLQVVAGPGVGLAAAADGIGPRLGRLFGFDAAMADQYPLRWWVVLSASLVLALGAARLSAGLAGPLVWPAVPLAWIWLSRAFFRWCERRRQDRLFRQFPDALAMIVRAVRVGVPVTDSIRAVGRELDAPTGPEFARLSDELAIGVVLDDALRMMAARNGLQEYRFFATALSLQSQTGGGLSETLENLADVIRKRVAVRQKGEALSSEAKMSALVLGLLPPLVGVALWVMNPAYMALMFTEPLGQKIFAAAILLLGGGAMCMRTMIRKSLS